jgi:hypothetical protein
MASRVSAEPETHSKKSISMSQGRLRQSRCNRCSENHLLQRYADHGKSEFSAFPPIIHEVLRSPGGPLDADVRAFMEQRFEHDFSRVTVHTDAKAAESARAVNALAFTAGKKVVFGAGVYSPRSEQGIRILGHELTHVVQQSSVINGQMPNRVSSSNDSFESDARMHESNIGRTQTPHRLIMDLKEPMIQRLPIGSFLSELVTMPISALSRVFGKENYNNEELLAYYEEFLVKGKTEERYDSDNKARAIIKRWKDKDLTLRDKQGQEKKLTLDFEKKAILVQELLIGYTSKDDETSILELICSPETSSEEVKNIVAKSGREILEDNFSGPELQVLRGCLSAKTETQAVVDTAAKESRIGPTCRSRKYDEALREGAELSKIANFGTVTGLGMGPDIKDGFDKTYWREDIESRRIVAIVEPPNKTPWIAIKELVESLKKRKGKTKDGKINWSLDCLESVQFVRIYAYWCTMSREEFDRKFNTLEIGWQVREIGRRLWNFDEEITAERPGQNPIVRPTTAGEEGLRQESGHPRIINKSWSQLIKEAPLGTWINWSNFHIHSTCVNFEKEKGKLKTKEEKEEFVAMCDFESENALKVGEDKYSAHDLGIQNRATIEKEMAKSVPRKYRKPTDYNDDVYIKKYIFIKWIRYPKEV